MKLLPAQLDLFVADALDVRAKHVMDLMSRNLFTLSKNIRTEPIHHQLNDSFIRVTGDEEHGIANVFDQDLLIFLVSQLVHAKNLGGEISRRVQFSGYEFWRFTGKKRINGYGYTRLWESLERLHHTHIETDIRLGDRRRNHQFTWLSELEQRWYGSRHIGYEVIIPEWLFEAVAKEKPWVVTLNPMYFQLTSPIERWLYLFARKSAGKQKEGWHESIDSLYDKSASLNSKDQFERSIRNILKRKDKRLFEYHVNPVQTIGRNSQRRELHFRRSEFWPEKHNRTLLVSE